MTRFNQLIIGTLIAAVILLPQTHIESKEKFNPTTIKKVELKPDAKLVSREVEIVVNRNAKEYFQEFLHAPLKTFIPKTSAFAAVEQTKPLTKNTFPKVGSQRLVCFTDGETVVEQVIELKPGYFKYLVTNYSMNNAKPIEYGIGEFRFSPLTKSTALVHWKYSFKLKNNEFPGKLGCLGRQLFKWSFLNGDYAEFMNASINAVKAYGEREIK